MSAFKLPLNKWNGFAVSLALKCGTTGAAFYYFTGLRIIQFFPPEPDFHAIGKKRFFFREL